MSTSSSKDLPPSTSPYFPFMFLRGQFCASPVYPPATTDLTGRTAIVTGANGGLGLECSRQLLSYRLSRLIIAVRSTAKGDNAAVRLRAQYPHADIQVWPLDLASYPSIQAFASHVDETLDRVDYVVLNAGVWKENREIVPGTGYEETFQVNYLSQALLTFLLVPVLKIKSSRASSPAQLTWVNSGLALAAKFPQRRDASPTSDGSLFRTFSSQEEKFDGQEAYCTSKLLAHYFLWVLADQIPADRSHVIVSITDPGFVRGTELRNNNHAKKSVLLDAAAKGVGNIARGTIGKTLEVGASALVDAVVNHGPESHGCFLWSWQISP